MKANNAIDLVADLLTRLPGATLESWRDPGQNGQAANEPIEFRLAITSPRSVAILAHSGQ